MQPKYSIGQKVRCVSDDFGYISPGTTLIIVYGI